MDMWLCISDGTMYRIEYRDIEVVSWHIFIAVITPQTKLIFRTTLRNVVTNMSR